MVSDWIGGCHVQIRLFFNIFIGEATRIYILIHISIDSIYMRNDLDIFIQRRVLRVDLRQFIMPDCEMLSSPHDNV